MLLLVQCALPVFSKVNFRIPFFLYNYNVILLRIIVAQSVAVLWYNIVVILAYLLFLLDNNKCLLIFNFCFNAVVVSFSDIV